MRDINYTEVEENKTVSLYELREQILDSFTKILTTTVSNDAFIEEMHPKILDLIGNQIKFLTERKREEINKNSREEIDQKYLKLEKQVSLIEKFYMMEKGEPQIKVNIEQEEIDKLKKDLVLNLKELNIRQEDDAHKKLIELEADYKNVEKKDNIHLLLLLPSLIRNFQDITTPDNGKKIEKSIECLEALGEVMIMEEIKKFKTDYENGKENYPDLLNKFPVIIISFNIITKPDNIDKINELKKSLRNLNKKMKNELGIISKPNNPSLKLGDIEPALLSPIIEEREEEMKVENPEASGEGHRENHEELKRKNKPENPVSPPSFFTHHFNPDLPLTNIIPDKSRSPDKLEKRNCKSR